MNGAKLPKLLLIIMIGSLTIACDKWEIKSIWKFIMLLFSLVIINVIYFIMKYYIFYQWFKKVQYFSTDKKFISNFFTMFYLMRNEILMLREFQCISPYMVTLIFNFTERVHGQSFRVLCDAICIYDQYWELMWLYF